MATLPQEILFGTAKVEDIPKFTQEKLGVPAELIRDDGERQAFGETIMEAATAGLEGGGVDEQVG